MCVMLITFLSLIKPPETTDKKLLVWLNLAYFHDKFKRSCQFQTIMNINQNLYIPYNESWISLSCTFFANVPNRKMVKVVNIILPYHHTVTVTMAAFIVAQNTAVSSTSSLTLTKMAIDYCHGLTNVAISGKLFHSYINRETRPSSSYS